jgi:hypothetical protein
VNDQVHWPSVLQLGFSLAAAGILWVLAASLAMAGMIELVNPSQVPEGGVSILLMAAGAFLGGVLMIPSAGLALARLTDREIPEWAHLRPILHPVLLSALGFLLVLLLGHLASQTSLAWLLLPPLHLLAVGLPILGLVYLARQGLSAGSPQRTWGVLASGTALAPALILVAEFAALIGMLAIVFTAISAQPDLANEIERLARRLSQVRDPDAILQILSPYILNPIAIFSALSFSAVAIPLIEELIKPIGVWLLINSSLTPVQGFSAGVLSGAGYALFENLALGSSGESWAAVVLARVGTGVIHIYTAGLMGWALALAWTERRYVRLGLAYLAAVLIHGLWNAISVLSALSALPSINQGPSGYAWLDRAGVAGPLGLILFTLLALAFLIKNNHMLRERQAAQSTP